MALIYVFHFKVVNKDACTDVFWSGVWILFSDLGGPPKMHAQMLTCVVNSNEQKTLTESRNSFLTIKERPQMCGELG